MEKELKSLNKNLRKKISGLPPKELLRKYLEEEVGNFKNLKKMPQEKIKKFFKERPLVGVDGSLYTYGTAFPYTLTFFKALAKSTFGKTIEKTTLCTPLIDEYYEKIEKYSLENKIPLESASTRLRGEMLAFLEIETAIKAIHELKPRVLLLDGGFLRYRSLVPDIWKEFKKTALENDCIPVGVIEEIGTFEIKKLLSDKLPETCKNSYDRELLYGTFFPGEYLKVYSELVLKRGYYTCFGRLSLHPKACAWDFFEEQKKYSEEVISYLYTITPRHSRGVPLWLDIVDSEVRLTKNMTDLLIESFLEPELKEIFFTPSRENRDI